MPKLADNVTVWSARMNSELRQNTYFASLWLVSERRFILLAVDTEEYGKNREQWDRVFIYSTIVIEKVCL